MLSSLRSGLTRIQNADDVYAGADQSGKDLITLFRWQVGVHDHLKLRGSKTAALIVACRRAHIGDIRDNSPSGHHKEIVHALSQHADPFLAGIEHVLGATDR